MDKHEVVAEIKDKWVRGILRLRDIPEYMIWFSMRQRCTDPRHKDYKYYGELGVEVYLPWRNDFWAFFRDVGPRPEHWLSLDRIDPYGNYEPGNVRWADSFTQATNKRKKADGSQRDAKLTWEQVRTIRSLAGQLSQNDIAELCGIDQTHVSQILRGLIWHDPDYVPLCGPQISQKGQGQVLTAEKVSWIKLWLFWGYNASHIAAKYGVTARIIYLIRQNEIWDHVPIADPEDCPEELWPPEAMWPFYPVLGLERRI